MDYSFDMKTINTIKNGLRKDVWSISTSEQSVRFWKSLAVRNTWKVFRTEERLSGFLLA